MSERSTIGFCCSGIGRADDRALAIDQADVLDRGPLIHLQTNRLQRFRRAIQRAPLCQLFERRCSRIDREFGAPQGDFGQLVQLLDLLAFDDRPRGEMPAGRKDHQARGKRRQLGNARPLEFHRTRALDITMPRTVGGRALRSSL